MAAMTGTEERYAMKMGELWSVLALTLAHLDRLAAEPERLDEDEFSHHLRRLQYSLHVAGERVYGLAPPPGGEPAHSELSAALGSARDATGEIAETLEEDGVEASRLSSSSGEAPSSACGSHACALRIRSRRPLPRMRCGASSGAP